jgi:hypothetical protein
MDILNVSLMNTFRRHLHYYLSYKCMVLTYSWVNINEILRKDLLSFNFWSSGLISVYLQRLWLRSLTPLSTILQLFRGGQLYLSKQSEYQEKTIDLPQVTDKLYHIVMYRAYLAMRVIGTRTLVVIGTDYKGSCKSNYHTITTATVPSLCACWLRNPQ